MLTNMFYFNYYKPYMISRVDTKKDIMQKKLDKLTKPPTETASNNNEVNMNKSLKSDVLDYITGVSNNVNGLKDKSRDLTTDMESFNKNIVKVGYDTAKNWIEDGIDKYVDTFNDAVEFMDNQTHSSDLSNLSKTLVLNIAANNHNLDSLGLEFDVKSNKLNFDKEAFKSMSKDKLNVAIGSTLDIFKQSYKDSTSTLQEPLTSHMNFKSLNYYYNYKVGPMTNDTFRIMESGLIVDRAV